LFGTDGIRAPFGEPPLDRPTVTALGAELATLLGERRGQPRVVLGGDTRESTPEICGWLAAGLAAGGAAVRYGGVVPTPGVSFLTERLGADAGIAVSASHNPYPDNGIKLLDAQGFKWSEEAEAGLERRLRRRLAGAGRDGGRDPRRARRAGGAQALTPDPDLHARYLRHLASTLPADAHRRGGGRSEGAEGGRPLAGLRVVLDAGNGAASVYAGELFERLGAEVELLSASPDGRNVNLACGSTAPAQVAAATVARHAHLGAAFDGDADRCILADERGAVRDGDAILYLWASCLKRAGRLTPPRIVATSMSNLGLERALAREGIAVVRTGVGDRLVVEAMRREGIVLGGEQSGHIVHLPLAATGDGLLTAAQMAYLVADAGRPLSELLAGFHRFPQVLVNVRVARKVELTSLPAVARAARRIEERLGADGRLVLRYSGTEPLARVMIEGPEQKAIEGMAEELAAAIRAEIGAPA
jgi:phosphoglucosamine mutase